MRSGDLAKGEIGHILILRGKCATLKMYSLIENVCACLSRPGNLAETSRMAEKTRLFSRTNGCKRHRSQKKGNDTKRQYLLIVIEALRKRITRSGPRCFVKLRSMTSLKKRNQHGVRRLSSFARGGFLCDRHSSAVHGQ